MSGHRGHEVLLEPRINKVCHWFDKQGNDVKTDQAEFWHADRFSLGEEREKTCNVVPGSG